MTSNTTTWTIDPAHAEIGFAVRHLMIATVRGRKARKGLKLGICGEHGGDPASIRFVAELGLDYVSCSPYRVPIARLAAAQAEIALSEDKGTRTEMVA